MGSSFVESRGLRRSCWWYASGSYPYGARCAPVRALGWEVGFLSGNCRFLADFGVCARCARRVTGAHQVGRRVGLGLPLGREQSAAWGGALVSGGAVGVGGGGRGWAADDEGGEREGGDDEQDAGGDPDQA